MIHLDTSVLIDAFTTHKRSLARVRAALRKGEPLNISAIVLFEWLRGPRRPEELAVVDALFPRDEVVVFAAAEASRAAELYRRIPRARARAVDIAIAACALTHTARLWTLNPEDFEDIPGLLLYRT